jgi:hypothetical protein
VGLNATPGVEAHVLPITFVCVTVHSKPSLDFTPYPKTSRIERPTPDPEKTQQSWIVRLVPAIRSPETMNLEGLQEIE